MIKKKKIKTVLAAVACLTIAAAASGAYSSLSKETADIPEHDGEVLVDSLNVSESDDAQDENGATEDTELVTSDDVSDMAQSDTYFKEMRASINLDRNEMIAMYTDAEVTAGNSTEKENAQDKKMKLMQNMQMEQDVENAIAAKGMPECLVLISENGVNVTVNKQELNDTDVAKICDIVMRETGMKASDIIIQSKF